MKHIVFLLAVFFCGKAISQAPVVSNVRFEQRTDGSLLVDIYYDVSDPDNDTVDIIVEASDDGGMYYFHPCQSLTGDVGRGIPTGENKHVVWDFYKDSPGINSGNFRIRVTAFDELCGSVIKEDIILTEDLYATPGEPGALLSIAAPNITLDLGGHTIYCDPDIGMKTGVGTGGYSGMTIKNGTIEGCLIGVDAANSDSLTIENLTIRNLEMSGDENVGGIVVYDSEDVLIRNCMVELTQEVHKEAVVNYHSYITIDSLETFGCAVGVNLCPEFEPRDNGIIRNSKFDGAIMAAILDLYSSGILIQNNEFINCETSIMCEPGYPGAVRGILMEENHIYNNVIGVYLTGAVESTIRNNNIHHNEMFGIALQPWGDVYARNNLIANNEVIWQNVDLHHCDSCINNTWIDNKFYTKNGDEIPDPVIANTATARAELSSVNSAAMSIAEDAQLLTVYSGQCDTIGESGHWVYIFSSAVLDQEFEIWYFDGQVVEREELSDPGSFSDDNLPIPALWTDSDTVLEMALESGGRAFYDEHHPEIIEMDLLHSAQDNELRWNVRFIAEGTSFAVSLVEPL